MGDDLTRMRGERRAGLASANLRTLSTPNIALNRHRFISDRNE